MVMSVRQRLHALAWLWLVWLATSTAATKSTTTLLSGASAGRGGAHAHAPQPPSTFQADDGYASAPAPYSPPSPASRPPLAASIARRGALGNRAATALDLGRSVGAFRFSAPPFAPRTPSNPEADYDPSSSTSFEPSIEDLTLSPLVLVVTVDGHVHALRRDSGEWMWTLHDDSGHAVGGKGGATDVPYGSPLVQGKRGKPPMSPRRFNSSSPAPPSSSNATEAEGVASENDDGGLGPDDDEIYVIEPTAGGEIYLYDRSRSKDGHVELEKLPLSMQELVALSPFTFPSDSSRMFMGRSDSKIVAVDLKTGRLVGEFGTGGAAWCEWDPSKVGVKPDLECDDEISRRPQDLLYMGRTEYTLYIYSKRSPEPLQTLTYTTYTSSALGVALQAKWTHTPDNRYLQPMHDGSLVCFEVGRPTYSWSMAFDAPVMSVFDIALPAASGEYGEDPGREFDPPLMFEQPHPLLVEGLPIDLETWQRWPETTFIGRVGNDLFAMSRDRYPLIAVAPVSGIEGGPIDDRGGLGSGESEEDGVPNSRECRGLDCLVGRHPVLESHIAPIGSDSSIDPPSSRLLIDGPGPTAPSTPTSPNHSTPPVPTRSSVLARLSAPISSISDRQNNGLIVVVLLAILGYLYVKKSNKPTRGVGETVNAFMQRVKPTSVVEPAESSRKSERSKSNGVALILLSSDSTSSSPEDQQPMGLLPALSPSPPIGSGEHTRSGSLSSPLLVSSKELPPLPPPEDDLENGDGNDSDGAKEGLDGTPRKKSRRRRGKKQKKTLGLVTMGLEGDAIVGSGPTTKSTMLEGLLLNEGGEGGTLELGAITLSEAETKEEDGEEVEVPDRAVGPQSVGGLSVSDTILGYGSHGTVVLRGEFQGRAVAVKRLLKDFVTIATHEVALLQESDDHPHVIRYYCKEQRDTFLYIALELCPASLFDLIDQPSSFPELVKELDPKRALKQITSGIRHLHKLKIVHRDIKPQNILVSTSKHHGLRMLISDFGLCKKLDVDESSFQQTMNHAAGSFGYRAPEVLRGLVDPEQEALSNTTPSHSTNGSPTHARGTSSSSSSGLMTDPSMRLTRSIDIFSLGCIVYYVLTGGEHPFGGRYEREMNILQGKISLERLDGLGEEAIEVQDLITQMVATDPRERPTAEAVLLHPFFWNAQKRLLFICDASDRFEIMERDPPTPTLVMLESRATEIVGDDWQKAIDRSLLDNLGKYRKYDGKSVRDLLRVLRNKKHHYQDLPESVRRNLGELPGGFLSYFTLRFPHLLLHVYDTVATHLYDEPMFASTFRVPEEEQ